MASFITLEQVGRLGSALSRLRKLGIVTIAEVQTQLEQRLRQAGLASPRAEALLLLEALLDLSRTELLLARRRELTTEDEATLKTWLERRLKREPLQHILGVAPFYGLMLRVTPNVLIPRPETERLVELVLDDLRSVERPKLLDVGTGSGAIALALKGERPDAEVMASDVSAAALKVARGNAAEHGLEVAFARSDLLAAGEVTAFAREADVIVANLPYLPERDRTRVSPEVRRDPALALYAGEDGLELYRRLEREAFNLMRPGARLWLELDLRNVQAAAELARKWRNVRIVTDLLERERFLRLER